MEELTKMSVHEHFVLRFVMFFAMSLIGVKLKK